MSTTHARRAIREALVAALAGGATLAGARVFDHPTDPRHQFPALTVFDASEPQNAETMPAGPGRVIARLYLVEVTAEVQQVAGYARTRDDLLAEVEALLAAATLPGVKAITPAGFDAGQYVEGERPICVGRQRFEVLYYTTQGNPAATL